MTLSYSTALATIDTQKSKIRTHGHALHHHLPPKKSEIRPQDHAQHHHWPPKIKDLNPWPCTTPPLTSKKSNIRTQDRVLHHHWPPKRQRFEHTTMHYTIDPKKAKIQTHDHALHHQWLPKVKDSNQQTYDHAICSLFQVKIFNGLRDRSVPIKNTKSATWWSFSELH
jgi:hypothetical protein